MKKFYSFLLCCIMFTCKAERTGATYNTSQQTNLYNTSSAQNAFARDTFPNEIITIPVVIHILYNNAVQNISDAQVLSQIASLNQDYRKLNNTANIPSAFAPLAADSKITFCIAKTDPQGKLTNGIIHKYTQIAGWSADDQMKFSASAGDNAWDSKRYLNIWVCNLNGSLGYSSLPGSPADKDGVVIQYDVFGTTGTVRSPFNKGRTATHEIGHWLGLLHLWGDALCGDDKIDDTPPQKTYNNGYPSFPHMSTCSINKNGDMFMDFMDFTDDSCMSMFTYGQKNKMRSLFALGNVRNSFLNSSVCNTPPEAATPSADTTLAGKATVSSNLANLVSLYPNPAKDFINIQAGNSNELIGQTLVIYNILGREVKRQILTSAKTTILINNIAPGIYVVKIGEGKNIRILRMVKQ